MLRRENTIRLLPIPTSAVTERNIAHWASHHRGLYYAYFGDQYPSSHLEKILQLHNVTPLKFQVTDNFRESFFRDFQDLIGRVSNDTPDRLWQASNICSKNRFHPDFLIQLYDLEIIRWLTQHAPVPATIIGINLSPNILDYARISGLPISVPVWPRIKSFCADFAARGFQIAKTIRQMAILIYRRLRFHRGKPGKYDSKSQIYLIKSFAYDSSIRPGPKYTDPFFGILPDYLAANGQKPLVLANLLGNIAYLTKEFRKIIGTKVNAVDQYLTPLNIVSAAFRLMKTSMKITTPYDFRGIPVTRLINRYLYRRLNDVALYQYLHYDAIRNLLKKQTVHTYIQTYENNPWERMCLKAFRDFSPQTRLIGYHHNVAPMASQNLFRSRYDTAQKYFPDEIITVGPRARNLLIRQSTHAKLNVKTGCALRYSYLDKTPTPRKRIGNRVLIALEGQKEAAPLIEFACRQFAEEHPFIVTFRFHPAFGYRQMRSYLVSAIPESEMLRISTEPSIQTELEKTDVLLYWGSAVSLEAIAMGIPVIHFDKGGIQNFDPLFECKGIHFRISPEENLVKLLNQLKSLPVKRLEMLRKKSNLYMQDYFHSVTPKRLQLFNTR